MKVYVVEQGVYSDRRLVGVVTDLRNVDLNGLEHVRITETELNDIPSIPVGYSVFEVYLDSIGTDVYPTSFSLYTSRQEFEYVRQDGSAYFLVVAESEEHAAKIATERLRAYKVENP